MASSRVLGSFFIALTVFAVVTGIAGNAANAPFNNTDWESTLMIDPGFIGIFAFTLGLLLLKQDDESTIAQASALLTLAIVCAAATPTILTRISMTLFANGYYRLKLSIPLGITMAAVLLIGVLAIYVAVKQSRRVHSEDNDNVIVASPINKHAVSVVMIINGLISFGLAVALLQERFSLYSVVALNVHAVMLFATGITGIVADKKKAVHLNVWHKTLTVFTAGLSATAMVSIIQTLVHFVNDLRYPQWKRVDFTILTLSQALFTITGLVISLISVVAADDVEDQSGKHLPRSNTNVLSVGLLVSSFITGGFGAFNIAIMNYTPYGLPALLIASMAAVAAKYGINLQRTNNELLKYPHFVLNVLTGIASLWALGVTIFQFVGHSNTQTGLIITYRVFTYIFLTLTGLSLIAVSFFSIKSARNGGEAFSEFSDKKSLSI